ncbi:glycosyltransferase family 4 protein [candidate division WWE3 bacterium]|nr:glycosyltransferase family 4 protein [candidate division WWE3 bacterium]
MNTYTHRIGIDASRAFTANRTGTENYSYQIIKSVASLNKYQKIELFVRPTDSISTNFTQLPVNIQTIPYHTLWTQVGLAKRTWTDQLDLLFIPAHVIPFLKRPSLPVVVTVHDLRTEFLPQHSDWRQRIYLNQAIELIRARLAAHIIAVSESTKKDIVKLLGIAPNKITVVYEGVDRNRFNSKLKTRTTEIQKIMRKYSIDKPFLLFVGTVQPRKNIARLINAYAKLLKSGLEKEYELVIAGKKGWMSDDIYETPSVLNIHNQVHFLDYIDDADLPYLYAGAEVFVFPSLYEGFGLPVLEALSSGTKVLTSNNSSLPEVGGNVVTYVDAENIDDIAAGIKQSLASEFNFDLVNRHLQKFSWEKAGLDTTVVFDKILRK